MFEVMAKSQSKLVRMNFLSRKKSFEFVSLTVQQQYHSDIRAQDFFVYSQQVTSSQLFYRTQLLLLWLDCLNKLQVLFAFIVKIRKSAQKNFKSWIWLLKPQVQSIDPSLTSSQIWDLLISALSFLVCLVKSVPSLQLLQN